MRQQLKINGIWAILPQNFKVTIKRTNPLFNSEGDFSFPFNIDPRLNKAILESAADPLGRFSLRRLNGLPVEYWFDGQLMFRGYCEVKDSLTFKDTISLNFNSGVRSITERVKDMNAQDVSVERLQLGYACTGLRFSGDEKHEEIHLPDAGYMEGSNWGPVDASYVHPTCPAYDTGYIPAPVKNALYTLDDAFNVTRDSREFPYCNTRVAIDLEDANRLLVLDYKRRDSAPCMYVMYWLKRLFRDLDIAITNNFEQMEDMCRLAFFSTFPKYTTEEWEELPHYGEAAGLQADFEFVKDPYTDEVTPFGGWAMWKDILPQYDLGNPYSCTAVFFHANMGLYHYSRWLTPGEMFHPYYRMKESRKGENAGEPAAEYEWDNAVDYYGFRPAFLSSKQYPDTKVQTILDDLHDIFGLRIIYDTVTNHARVCYIKDVLDNAPTKYIPAEYHGKPVVTRSLNPGIIITYGKERADDSFSVAEAAYDYDMPDNEKMVVSQPFADTLSMVHNSTDHHTYYDPRTGNAAVIAVDPDSDELQQGATPFEVGQFNDYLASVTDKDKATTRKASFEPVVCNDVSNSLRATATVPDASPSATVPDASPSVKSNLVPFPGADKNSVSTDNMYETLQSDEAILPSTASYDQPANRDSLSRWFAMCGLTGTSRYGLAPDLENMNGQPLFRFTLKLNYASNSGECCDMTKSDSPLQKWQDGKHYVLGFMRGAGNDSGIEYDSNTFNQDGTRGWESVVGTPTFTSDSVDQFGNVFDYNGTDEGGIDQTERLSLKLDARKVKSYNPDGTPTFYPIDSSLANRGLAVRMLSSLLHFETHRKTITHKAAIAIGAIMNIDWCAQYPMQDCVGFINSIQVDLSENGVGESTIEQYILDE